MKRLFFTLVDLLLSTCRAKFINKEHLDDIIKNGKNVVLTIWHSDVLLGLYFHRRYKSVVLVSPSGDGDWASDYVRFHGSIPLRGSRGKGGLRAVNEIITMMQREPYLCGIVADGSRGPACKVQNGVLYIAKETGAPIVPLSIIAKPAIRLKNWDKTIMPIPFCKVILFYGEPIFIPKNTDRNELNIYKEILERRLNDNKLIAENYL